MKEAVIVATARTPIGRAFRGSLNNTKSPALTAHVLRHAAVRAGIEGAEIDDVIIGCALAAGTAGMNVARMAALAAGFPVSVPGQTLDRQCASGLMAVATGAKQVIVDGMQVVIAGGQENISAVQNPYFEWAFREQDPQVTAHANAYMGMLKTAEFVARKYKIPREAQDAYALESQRRTAAAQTRGFLDAEIVPVTATMAVLDVQSARRGRVRAARRPAQRRQGDRRHPQVRVSCADKGDPDSAAGEVGRGTACSKRRISSATPGGASSGTGEPEGK